MYLFLTFFGRFSLLASAITVTVVYVIMFFVSWFMYVRKCISLSLMEYIRIFEKSFLVIASVVLSLFVIRASMVRLNSDITNVMILFAYILLIILFLYFSEKDTIRKFLKR